MGYNSMITADDPDDNRSVREIVEAMEAEGRGLPSHHSGALPTVAWPGSARRPKPTGGEDEDAECGVASECPSSEILHGRPHTLTAATAV